MRRYQRQWFNGELGWTFRSIAACNPNISLKKNVLFSPKKFCDPFEFPLVKWDPQMLDFVFSSFSSPWSSISGQN